MDTKVKLLLAAIVWCLVIGAGVFGYNHFLKPVQEKQAEQKKQEQHEKVLQSTSSASRYQYNVTINADAFTGYCLLRSRTFRDECGKKAIKVDIVDDQADYNKRLRALADGSAQMAVFTIDALIKASASLGDMPATIILIVDETNGADAIMGSKKAFPNLDALNDPEVKIVATQDSPSEFIARVIMRHYNLPQLSPQCFKFVNGAEEVYRIYKTSDVMAKQAYALWEPYVSKMKDNPDYHSLIDSSKFRGYLVDVLVVSRDFAVKNPQVVEDVAKAYLTTVFNRRNDMTDLIVEDTKMLGQPVSKEQAEALTKAIWFKNTTENFEHLGLTTGHNLQHIDEMIVNITDVLRSTGAIKSDPSKATPSMWYYNALLQGLFKFNWYPGFGAEAVHQDKALAQLGEADWKKLEPVGTLRVPRLVFARGTAVLTDSSETTLTELVDKLKAWPQYYLMVRGNCAKDSDPEVQKANMELALARSKAAMEWLIHHGVDRNRVAVAEGEPNGSTTVSFVLGQIPY
jgi:outer membrane protein OmpA-like peptidoglycan-associated protein/ABC-type taurine transport system substrate-binding protein